MKDVKPFVKWAGGKNGLLSQLNKYYPTELKNNKIENYIEPFLGGGAVLIHILQNYDVKKATAFDTNADLINCYLVIKNNVDELIKELSEKEREFKSLNAEERKKYYYEIRKEYNSYNLIEDECNVKRAMEFIFLNKTCFNGLYRVNSNNKFNVPYNNAKNPSICDKDNLSNLSKLIKNVEFICGDYKIAEKYISNKTFIYFDPPYRPLSVTSGFTSYTKDDFDDEDQVMLSKFYRKISGTGAKLMLSNSDPQNINEDDDFFIKLYEEFNFNKVLANRSINAKGTGRKPVTELIITNYETLS